MALRQCEGLERNAKRKRKLSNCRSRNNTGVYLVDGKHVLCASCFEVWLEVNSLDEHRVVRLSDRDSDFSEFAHAATARTARA